MPREVVARIAESVGVAMKDPETRQRLATLGFQPAYLGPADFAAPIADMAKRYSTVIDEAKITLE